MLVDEAIRDALHADRTGALRSYLLDLAAKAFRLSCVPDAGESAAMLRLATALREAASPQARAQPAEGLAPTADAVRAGKSSPMGGSAPAGADDAALATGPGASAAARLPERLARARDDIRDKSNGRLDVTADDAAQAWRQLHLGTLWLPESVRGAALGLLGAAEPEYLVPPHEDAGEPGLAWSAAEEDADVMAALASWPPALREPGDRLAPVLSLVLTVADLASGLFTAGSPADGIVPLATTGDRRAFREWILGIVAKLAAPGDQPNIQVDWLGALDGAMRSVFPLPVPSRHSVWAKRLDGSLDELTRQVRIASPDGEVTLLRGGTRYEDPRRRELAPDASNIAIRPFTDAERNQVLWPLRAYVKLPGTEAAPHIVRHGSVLHGHDNGFAYPGAAG
jgi:hypothetical protein